MSEQSRRLRIGVQLNTTQREFRWAEIRDLARAVEDAGLDSVWTEDHIQYQDRSGRWIGPWDAWTILAGVAAVTERVRIGTMVSPLSLRHPVLLARHVASVQEMSGGRLVLGIGLGHGEAEYRALGLNLEHRFSKFREAFEVLRHAFNVGTADHQGTYVRTEGFQLLPRPRDLPGPQLMIGSDGPKTLRLTLPHVAAWNWDGFVDDPDEFAAACRAVDAICNEIRRDPREIQRTAHLVVRLSNPEGLPIDPLPDHLRVIEGGPMRSPTAFRPLPMPAPTRSCSSSTRLAPRPSKSSPWSSSGCDSPHEALRRRPRWPAGRAASWRCRCSSTRPSSTTTASSSSSDSGVPRPVLPPQELEDGEHAAVFVG